MPVCILTFGNLIHGKPFMIYHFYWMMGTNLDPLWHTGESCYKVAIKGDPPLEVHLMVEEPRKFVEGFVNAGADAIIFHLEVEPEPIELIRHIRGLGKKVGLAFNPDFPVDRIASYLNEIDLALCMTVFPGFGGQAFIPESLGRIRQLAELIRINNPACELEVDGGIDARTISSAAKAGATVFVAGTAIFGAKVGIDASVAELSRLAAQ